MTDTTEARLWRNYRHGRVGFQLAGKPKRLVVPARAREIADELEADIETGDAPPLDEPELARFVADLRAYADDVENVADESGVDR